MTLDQLRYALALQRHRNFSRAAEELHITQPSLSAQIAKLEEELGLTLFDRSRTHVEVTEYGVAILRQARRVLDETVRIPELVQELKGEVGGAFRLGVIPTLAPSLLPLFLKEFGQKFPKVRLSIVEEPTERLIQRIHEGSLDGALLSTPTKTPDSILERVLFYEPFFVFASAGHPILENKKLKAAHLHTDEILLLDETHCLRDQVLQLCKARSAAGETRFEIQSGSLLTLIEVLRRQKGFTLLPALSLAFLTQSERTKNTRGFDEPLPARKVSLVYHRAHLKRSVLEALRHEILARIPADVYPSASDHRLRVLAPKPDHFEL